MRGGHVRERGKTNQKRKMIYIKNRIIFIKK